MLDCSFKFQNQGLLFIEFYFFYIVLTQGHGVSFITEILA